MKHSARFRSAIIVGLLVLSAATARAYNQATSSDGRRFLPSAAVSRPSVRINQIVDYASSDPATSLHAAALSNTIYLPLIRSVLMCNDIEQRPNDPIGNDNQLTAGQLTTIGKTCEGSLEDDTVGTAGDDDYYWLNLNFGDEATIDLTGIPEGANYDLYFYRVDEPDQTPKMASSEALSHGDEQIIYTAVRTAKYYIRIRMKNKSTAAPNTYQLRVVSVVLGIPPPCNDIEPNDIPEQARQLTAVGKLCIGSLQDDSQGEGDYYWVDLAANQVISIDAADIPVGADYDLSLIYTQDAHVFNVVASSRTTGQSDEQITYHVETAGRYYIRIFMRSKSLTADNTYILGVSPLDACDPFEPNDNRRVNPWGPLVSGQAYQARICSLDSEDNYYFESVTSSPVQISLALPSSLVGNTFIWLYAASDPSSPLAACGAAPVTVPNLVLSCPIPSPGRYIVRIYTDTVVDNVNPYTLQVTYQ